MRRAAKRRRPHLALGCVVAGLAVSPARPLYAVAIAVTVAAAAAWAFRARGALTASVRAATLAAGLVLVAASAGAARIDAIDRPARAAPPGSALEAEATLLERPRRTAFGSSAPLEIETGAARGLRVLARADAARWPTLNPGARFRIRALVRVDGFGRPAGAAHAHERNAGRSGTPGSGPLPALRDDDFDFAAFLRSRAIGRQVSLQSAEVVGRRGGVQGVVDGIRRRAERGIGAGLPAERAALARGMVLGQDGDVSEDVRDDFRRAGLAHLLAASGQNVALLCALALPLLMLVGASPHVRVAVLIPLVALYVLLAGAGASVARAGVMAVAALVALAAGRPASAVYALLLAAATTLALNPRATADPGWQLSFAAVAGMLALGPAIARRLPGSGLGREAVAVTIAASASTAPLLAHHFGAVSLVALPANLLAFPAVAPVMWIGLAQAAVAQLGALGPSCATIASALADVASVAGDLGLRWVAAIAGHAAAVGWAQADVRIGGWTATAIYTASAAAMGWLAARSRRGTRLRRTTRFGIATIVAGLALAAAGSVFAPAPVPRRLTVDFIDVGQGDATLVRDPSGAAILFDGGPPEARVDRTLRRLGVRRLSVVVATHQSRDHQGGLPQVIERFPVGLFVDGGGDTRDPAFLALRAAVARRGIKRLPARSGDALRVGETTVRILWPPPRTETADADGSAAVAPLDPNGGATVAVVSRGAFDLLLTADAESPVLLRLDLPRVEAMKVPHHGSEDPGLRTLLERIRPRVAAIEVGRGNRYGHPRRATLDALRDAGPRVYRTDRDGTVELAVEDGVIAIRTHR